MSSGNIDLKPHQALTKTGVIALNAIKALFTALSLAGIRRNHLAEADAAALRDMTPIVLAPINKGSN